VLSDLKDVPFRVFRASPFFGMRRLRFSQFTPATDVR
jgi:hypothetical protein